MADLFGKTNRRFGERACGRELSATCREPRGQVHQNKIELGRALISNELLGGEPMPLGPVGVARTPLQERGMHQEERRVAQLTPLLQSSDDALERRPRECVVI